MLDNVDLFDLPAGELLLCEGEALDEVVPDVVVRRDWISQTECHRSAEIWHLHDHRIRRVVAASDLGVEVLGEPLVHVRASRIPAENIELMQTRFFGLGFFDTATLLPFLDKGEILGGNEAEGHRHGAFLSHR